MDPDEKLYDLLMTEKKLADDQVARYLDLSLKVFAFFGVAITIMGWLYSDKGIGWTREHSVGAGVICVAVALLGCGVILEGVFTYGIALGYIQYKNQALNQAFVDVANITRQYPFNAVREWWNGAARKPVMLATAGIYVLHALASVALIGISVFWFLQSPNRCLVWLSAAAALFVLYTWYVEYRLQVAIVRVFKGSPGVPRTT